MKNFCQKVWSYFHHHNKGLISIFLAGVLVLTTVAIGAFNEIQLVTAAKAEMRNGLRLSSQLALSRFSKDLVQEFGLFALDDFEGAREEAYRKLQERLKPGPDQADMLAMDLTKFNLEASDGARLSKPRILEKQVVQFMDWQLAGLVLTPLLEEGKVLDHLAQVIPTIQAKVQFQEKLAQVQPYLDQAGKKIDQLASLKYGDLLPAGDQYDREDAFIFIPPMSLFSSELGKRLDKTLDQARQGEKDLLGLDEGSPEYQEIQADLEAGLSRSLKQGQEFYQEVQTFLKKLGKLGQDLAHSLQVSQEVGGGLEASKASWKKSLEGLDGDQLAASFWGDFYAQAKLGQMGEVRDLEEGMQELLGKNHDLLSAWQGASWAGVPIMDLGPEDFFDRDQDGQLLVKDLPSFRLGEGEEATAKELNQAREKKRAKFSEFIQAWKTKRKVIRNVRQAQRLGRENLEGRMTDRLDPGMVDRFSQDREGGHGPHSQGTIPIGNEREILQGGLDELEALRQDLDYLQGLGPGEDGMKVWAYWTQMFSSRTSPFHDQDQGDALTSLTGRPLHDRPIFGGEKEYILYGQDNLVKNLDKASQRLFAIRFLCNLVYAFSSPQLNVETSSLALALAGWTGFGVPLVQSALLASLACGEAYLDLQDLLDGKALPILKDQGTWRLSVSGIKPLAQDLVSSLFDQINEEVLSDSQALASLLKDQADQMIQASKESLLASLKTPLVHFILQAVMASTESLEDLDLDRGFDRVLGGVKARQGGGRPGRAVSQAVDQLAQDKEKVLAKIKDLVEARKKAGGKTQGTAEEVEAFVDGLVDPLCDGIKQAIDQVEGVWEAKAYDLKVKGTEAGQEALAEWLSGFQKDLGGGRSSNGSAYGLVLSYDDYLNLFLAGRAFSQPGRLDGLSNMAVLIQASLPSVDLTRAPSSLDWKLETRLPVHFLGVMGLDSGKQLKKSSKGVYLKEEWVEGYGLFRKEE